MRPSNKQRSRNKPGGSGNHNNQRRSMGNIVNRVFESAGPDGKVRGTPQQIIDKYQALARDAQVSGDRVAAESFLQHSEHYSRMLGEAMRQQIEQRASQERDESSRGEDQRAGEGRDDGGRGSDQRQDSQDDRGRGSDQRQDSHEDRGRGSDNRQDSLDDRGRGRSGAPSGPASGMATFDADDREAPVGLIETPEGRSEPEKARPSTPAAHAVSEVNGSGHPAAVSEDAPPARRPRTRRRAKPEEVDVPPASD